MDEFWQYLGMVNNPDLESIKSSCLTPVCLAPLVNNITQDRFILDDYLENELAMENMLIKYLDKDEDNSEKVTNEIFHMIQPVKESSQALKYIFYELLSNVYDHSNFDKGIVMVQNYPDSLEYEFCFTDNGISIPVSLKKSGYVYKNDCDAIIKAVNGLSAKHGNEFIGRGTGLNTVIDIVTRGAGGNVIIASACGVVEITKSVLHAKHSHHPFKGTLVGFKLNSRKEINIYNHMKGITIKGLEEYGN